MPQLCLGWELMAAAAKVVLNAGQRAAPQPSRTSASRVGVDFGPPICLTYNSLGCTTVCSVEYTNVVYHFLLSAPPFFPI